MRGNPKKRKRNEIEKGDKTDEGDTRLQERISKTGRRRGKKKKRRNRMSKSKSYTL